MPRTLIPTSEKERCFICNHLIKDNDLDDGFFKYGVAIHQQCHDNLFEFLKLRSNDPPDDAPQRTQPLELKRAIKWTENIKDSAERTISKEATVIPTDVMHRLNHLRDKGLSDRQYELVKMWSGVGAGSLSVEDSGDTYAISHTMQDIAKLPPLKDYVAGWWLFQAGKKDDHKQEVNFSTLQPNSHNAKSESAFMLRETLILALSSMLYDIPNVNRVYAMLTNKQRELPEQERTPVTLSEVVEISNSLEHKRAIIKNSYEYKLYSVAEVQDMLTDAHIEGFVVDCGMTRCTEDFKQAVTKFGDRAIMCAKCPNWFTVDTDKVEYKILHTTCPGCLVIDFPAASELPVPSNDVTECQILQRSLF